MLKKLSQLNKLEKIELIKDIAAGEVSKPINEDTRFATTLKEAFSGLMIAASPGNSDFPVVCIGEAKELKKQLDSFVELPKLNFDRIESSGLYKCQETQEELTSDQVQAMEKDYLITIEIVSDLTQPPEGYELIPKTMATFIGDLKAQNNSI